MIATKQKTALATIDEACDTYGCTKVFGLFSGGDDSLAALRVAMEHPKFVAAVHCNTGIGVQMTTDYVHETCRALRCPLIEYKATENVRADGSPDPQIYEQMVMEYGFPGPTKFGHGKMYVRLKERGIRRLLREHTDRKEKVVLASGCREEESDRRMGTTKRIQQGEVSKEGVVREPRRVWVNHLHDWSKINTLQLATHHNLERNPIAKLIGRSGECNCGAYAKPGELDQLYSFPETRPLAERILVLEKAVWDAGFPWRWEEGPPAWWMAEKRNREKLEAEMTQYDPAGPMCAKCEWRKS